MAALDVLLSVVNGRNNLKAAYNLQADMIALSPIYAPRLLDLGASHKRILTAMFLPEVASGLDHEKHETSLKIVSAGVVLISLQNISHITHWTLKNLKNLPVVSSSCTHMRSRSNMGTRSARAMEYIFPEDWYNLVLNNVPANMGRGNGQEVRDYQAPRSFQGSRSVQSTRAKEAALPNNSLVSLIAVEATIHSIPPGVPLTMNLTAQL